MSRFFKTAAANGKDTYTEATVESIVTAFELARDRMLRNTESKAIPAVFDEGRKLLDRMLEGEFEVFDVATFVQGMYCECQRRGYYPASLDAPICYATHQKNENGTPGSTPDKPHYRELAQVSKNTGRILMMAQLKHELGKVFIASCVYLGVTEPQNDPFDEKLMEKNYPNWQVLLNHLI
jgi:hypothetical protein